MKDKIFDFIPKDSKGPDIRHKFIKEPTLEQAIELHHIDVDKYAIAELTLDEFVAISDRFDEYFGNERKPLDEQKENLKDYQGVLLLTNATL
mgnify:CR=1 FL=1